MIVAEIVHHQPHHSKEESGDEELTCHVVQDLYAALENRDRIDRDRHFEHGELDLEEGGRELADNHEDGSQDRDGAQEDLRTTGHGFLSFLDGFPSSRTDLYIYYIKRKFVFNDFSICKIIQK